MVKKLLQIILLFAVIFSCVPNKKALMLQDPDTDLYGPAPKDTLLRTHYIIPDDYKLQHEDVVSIQINSLTPKEYDFFSQGLPQNQINIGGTRQGGGALFGYLIDANGEVEFPVVGKVKLGGLTIYEAEEKIRTISEEYLEEPVVRVRLLNFRFTVIGEVSGRAITINTFNNRMSMVEAIGSVKGFGNMADMSNVKIVRQEGNTAKVYYVNLLEEAFIQSPLYYVHPNDVIIVPPLKQKPFRNYFGQNLALILSSLSLLAVVLNLIAILNK